MNVERSFPQRAALILSGWAIVAVGSMVIRYASATAQVAQPVRPADAATGEPLSKQDLLNQRNEVPPEWLEASSEDKPTSDSSLLPVATDDVGRTLPPPPTPPQAPPQDSFQLQLGQEVLVDGIGTQRPVSAELGRLLPPTPVVLQERSTGRRIILDNNTTVVLNPNAGVPVASALNTTAPNQSVSLPTDKVEEARSEDLLYPLPFRVPLTSGFGMRNHPISGDFAFHQGIDFGAAYGTPILAAYSGQVVVAGPSGGLGNAVMLAHSEGLRTRYGHMSRVIVQPGEWIYQGDVLGYVGSTGNSTGPHLHFEIWTRDANTPWTAIDPSGQIQLAIARL
ncbi:MAG: M23 family metallopeptidase [Cyanobacteria bacterium J06642_2]